jgi:O-antigen/teichoic acid export membrane protein
MNHQAKGAALSIAFVAAFVVSLMLHSMVAAVSVLFTGVTVATVLGIACMRTSTHRIKQQRSHSVP